MKTLPTTAMAICLVLPLAAAAQSAAPAMPDKSAQVNVSMCTGCHTIPGYQASFPRVYHVPKISGQSAKYIEAALHGYKKGERDHPTMRAIAQGLSDAQITALAAYYAERGAEAK
jgi:cytochrome c553